MNILGTALSETQFISKFSSFCDDNVKKLLPMYYQLSVNSRVNEVGINPVIPILDLYRISSLKNINEKSKNPAGIVDNGEIVTFDTWVEGVKSHIDVVITSLGFSNEEFNDTRCKYCEKVQICDDKYISELMNAVKALSVDISENDLYGPVILNKLQADSIITDTEFWSKVMIMKTEKVSGNQLIYLLRKLVK